MPQTRRTFLYQLAALAATGVFTPSLLAKNSATNIKALAFDAFPVFDPRPVYALAEELFPGKGQELNNAWRTRQFEYQWLRALSDQYADFMSVTEDALVYAAKALQVNMTIEKQRRLLEAYLNLKVWPDAIPGLTALKKAGLKLVFLSNMTEEMLRHNMKANALDAVFDDVYSTDMIRSYKPSPKAYKIAMDKLKLKKQEIGFVAFAGWDASGAKLFGYPTFWVNRQKQVAEELDIQPDWVGNNLNELADYLSRQ